MAAGFISMDLMNYSLLLRKIDMVYHAHFLELNLANRVVEALGTDAVFILDGRNTLDNMILDTIKQYHRMNKNLHSYCGWRIKEGTRFDDSKTITGEKNIPIHYKE